MGRRGQEGLRGGSGSKDGQDVHVAGRARVLPDPLNFRSQGVAAECRGSVETGCSRGDLCWGETGEVIQKRLGPDLDGLEKQARDCPIGSVDPGRSVV